MMKQQTLLLAFPCIAAFIVGCDRTETTSQKLDEVQAKTAEPAQGLKDYTFAQKAEFIEKLQSQLSEIIRDLDHPSARIEESSGAVKTEAKLKIPVLRDQTAQLNKQLEAVKNATEPVWNDVKAVFKKGYGELKASFQHACQWVSDKIAS